MILHADDLTLKGKSTHLLAVVKSSNKITGLSFSAGKMPSVSLVFPKTKVCPAVRTGVLNYWL